MTPYERAERWHRSLGSPMTFEEVIEAHGEMGFIHSTPEVFVLARRVDSIWDEDEFSNLEFTDWDGDCWHVWLLAGDPSAAWKFLPYPLPFMSYHRRGKLRIKRLHDFRSAFAP